MSPCGSMLSNGTMLFIWLVMMVIMFGLGWIAEGIGK